MVDDDRDIDIETDGDDIEIDGSVRRVGGFFKDTIKPLIALFTMMALRSMPSDLMNSSSDLH